MPVTRRQRTSVVVLVGDDGCSDTGARALAASLGDCGIDALYLGKVNNPTSIAAAAAGADAEAVELCLAGPSGGAPLLRALLREFKQLGRANTSIVLHRVQ